MPLPTGFRQNIRKDPIAAISRIASSCLSGGSRDMGEIYVDTSGETLARHGYRKHSWKAPLAESLAASILSAMDWEPPYPFVNPMCGSGTLAIEAALLASGTGFQGFSGIIMVLCI
jgi:hypothetical protein